MIRRVLALAIVVLMSAGCTATHKRESAAITPTSSTSATADDLDGAAVTKYGVTKVQAVVRSMLAYTFDNGWNPKLIATHVDAVRAVDFADLPKAMTPRCAGEFTNLFSQVEKHDKAAIKTLEGAVYFGIIGPNSIRPTGAAGTVTKRSHSQVRVGVDTLDGVDRLTVSFTASADIHMADKAKKPWTLPTSRSVNYLLVPNTGPTAATTPFLIESWRNTMTTSAIRAD